jgi:PAS domain S-box-containing protein
MTTQQDNDERLRLSEDRFRQLLDLAPDAILGVDGRGVIILANALCESTFGYTRDEMAGRPVEMLVPAIHREHHHEHRRAYMASPSLRPMGVGRDLSALRRDGTEFPVTVTLSTIETEDGTVVLAAVHDLTDRVYAERERAELEIRLQQAQRIESVGQLAGGVAHDFNNLLAVILNYTMFVAEKVDDDETLRDLEQIRIAAERGADLTRQLLLFSRLKPSVPEPVDLGVALTEVGELLRRTIGEHVALDIRPASDSAVVQGDRGKLEQVLVNLIVNARDAMPDGGRITVDTARIHVVDDGLDWPGLDLSPGEYVCLRVTDTGQGMDQDVLARAFEPFFTTKPRGQGTGLGLATVYGIVSEAGGQVKIYSERGAGTTVSVYLPAAYVSAPVSDAPPLSPMPDADGSVLLVEDEDAVREIASRILGRHGFDVVAACSPAEALDLAGGIDRPRLVISDVVMPGMSGPDLVLQLREIWPGVPALLMSGYPADAAERVDVGSRALVYKPFTEAELLEYVHDVLEAAQG